MSLVLPSRRRFIGGLFAAIAAPYVVRASSLMPVSAKLMVPSGDIIGSIKPIVGAIPDGWIECNGRRLAVCDYPSLYASIGKKYGSTGEHSGIFHVPDLSAQARIDRDNGAMVGRYVIYGGDERRAYVADIGRIVGSAPERNWRVLNV